MCIDGFKIPSEHSNRVEIKKTACSYLKAPYSTF